MIYIIIPVHDRLQYTINCIESLISQKEEKRIIVVDDGSSDGTSAYLKTNFPDVAVLQGDGNLWWTGAMNKGVEFVLKNASTEDDFILSLNNDLVVPNNYLDELCKASQLKPNALIGSVTVDVEEKTFVHYAGVKWNAYTGAAKHNITSKTTLSEIQRKSNLLETSYLPGRGVLIPIKVFKSIGLYDEVNFPHYRADHDFSLRAKKAGFDLFISSKAVVYSHTQETGLKRKNYKSIIEYLKISLTSMKSPVNLNNRWRWAKKHAKSFPVFYFTLDMTRVLKSLLQKYLSA
ncbi:glycosyltransferase family 2 protein [Ilyomonas limi]|nr:glycosyltransferase family 2 protein [Ilyomonas limi]